jgi:hypothetical protein
MLGHLTLRLLPVLPWIAAGPSCLTMLLLLLPRNATTTGSTSTCCAADGRRASRRTRLPTPGPSIMYKHRVNWLHVFVVQPALKVYKICLPHCVFL